jgi:ankyrin repeat protein
MASARFALWNACQPLSSRPAGQQTQDVQACLAAGADPDEREPPWMSATFILLVTGGEHEAARLLLEAGAGDARAQVLHLLLMPERPLTMAKVVLDYARDKGLSGWVDVRDPGSDETPLLRASRMGQLQWVSLFLEHGADVRAVDVNGRSVLHGVRSPAVVHLLVQHGADANVICRLGAESPLHCADKVDVVDALLEVGANIDTQNSRGCTPAVFAVVCRKLRIAMRLVERGADVTVREQNGHTLLDHAVRHGCAELTRVLLGRSECSADDVDVAWAVQDIDDHMDYKADSTPMACVALLHDPSATVRTTSDAAVYLVALQREVRDLRRVTPDMQEAACSLAARWRERHGSS